MSAEGQTPLIRGGRNMYDELDDMGTGFEEAAEREYERREEAAIHEMRYPDEAILAFFAPTPRLYADMEEEITLLLKR
jgi:hypothetical protein